MISTNVIKQVSKCIMLPVLVIVMTSCATQITTKFTEQSIDIEYGDSAKIYWDFSNASGVQIEGHYKIYQPVDSVFVKPEKSNRYKVTAFENEKDDVSIYWNVNVLNTTKSIDSSKIANAVSTDTSGIAKYTDAISGEKIEQLNIVGTKTISNDSMQIKFVARNNEGQYISNREFSQLNFVLNVQKESTENNANDIIESNIISVTECAQDEDIKNNFCICLDNSDAATQNVAILNLIESASLEFPMQDGYFLSYFNQNFGGVFEIIRDIAGDGRFNSEFKNIPFQSGFTAINKSVGQAINYFTSNNKENTVFVIITSSSDNASVLYDENDLISHAQKNNIPINVIAIGTSTPTYNLAQLASHTGGKLFIVDEDKISNIANYLKLIINSVRKYYAINVALKPPIGIANAEVHLDLLKNSEHNLTDMCLYPLQREKMYSEYQTLAYYDKNSVEISDLFEPSIGNLAEVLKSNPSLIVELIGNSGTNEGSDVQCQKLALQRARIVRQAVIESGVKPEQIRASSEGSARPLYLFPKSNWQHRYNNRLEIRWLLPEDYPYEIVTDVYLSEDETYSNVEKWEDKGYKAYYQRILQNNRPAYRVLIWGYKTESEANAVAKKLSQEYKKRYYVK